MDISSNKLYFILDKYEKKVSTLLKDNDRKGIDELNHVKDMISKMRDLIKENNIDKVYRWLGFIQGVFYSFEVYSISQMADHNRPTKEELKSSSKHSFSSVRGDCPICVTTFGCIYRDEYINALTQENVVW